MQPKATAVPRMPPVPAPCGGNVGAVQPKTANVPRMPAVPAPCGGNVGAVQPKVASAPRMPVMPPPCGGNVTRAGAAQGAMPPRGVVMQPKAAPFRGNVAAASVQRVAAPSAVVQRAGDYGNEVKEMAEGAGARLAKLEDDWVELATVSRKKFSWFSKKILAEMGVEAKPTAGSVCPGCGTAASAFELDHMTPWRQYIAVTIGEDDIWNNKGKLYVRKSVAKALYNDKENLWWLCDKCNGKKTDIIPETAAHAGGDFSSGATGRSVGLQFSSV